MGNDRPFFACTVIARRERPWRTEGCASVSAVARITHAATSGLIISSRGAIQAIFGRSSTQKCPRTGTPYGFIREITFFTFSSDRPREVNQIVFGMWASFRDSFLDRNFPDLQGAEVADREGTAPHEEEAPFFRNQAESVQPHLHVFRRRRGVPPEVLDVGPGRRDGGEDARKTEPELPIA